ncbi:SDR family NAD(P)-dependent oxidoreductase [Hymenobacter wooponensis]|uniref:SDR family oxidoreductase n=1 Tax=Hymenobacter wooponensis TaxID=1525360 RepID=A0A4Z0MIF9_9BACT|nr:SDR family oxidoreductase [Hymenobacter wooponensis]TGD78965.1 SDR family oxidoreductase [Hymenobacter wooponensis]
MTTSKIALITGGSRGIGKDTALSLAKQGTNVLLTYQSKEAEALATVAEIQALGQQAAALQLDTANVAAFDAFYARVTDTLATTFGAERFDFLINNAGSGLGASFAETTEAQFDHMLNVHFKGVYFLTQKALPLLHDGGRIVNISTGLTRSVFPNRAAYASMKGAIEVLTKHQAHELGPRRITVNVVAPGAIATDFSGGIVRDNPQVNAHIAEQTALGRAGLASDVGGVIAFLCTDVAGWITGQRLEVSGGMHL